MVMRVAVVVSLKMKVVVEAGAFGRSCCSAEQDGSRDDSGDEAVHDHEVSIQELCFVCRFLWLLCWSLHCSCLDDVSDDGVVVPSCPVSLGTGVLLFFLPSLSLFIITQYIFIMQCVFVFQATNKNQMGRWPHLMFS